MGEYTEAVCENQDCDYVSNVLVYLHGKCRDVEKSRKAFDLISDKGKKTVLCWNAMIGAYVQNGCSVEALEVFKLMMEKHDCRPNLVSMVNVLSACAEVGDLDLGIWVHEYLKTSGQKGILSSNVNLATSLIDMYSKCGDLDGARKVFNQMSKKDVVSFNAMIIGLAVNLPLGSVGFDRRGSQCGEFDVFLKRANNYVWGASLAGCVLHNKLELGGTLSSNLVRVDPENSVGYVMMSNSFAADSQWRDVAKMRGVMREKGGAKQPGCSWIKVGGFVAESASCH